MTTDFTHPDIPTEDWDDTPADIPTTPTAPPEEDRGFDETTDEPTTEDTTTEPTSDYSHTHLGRLFTQVFGHPQDASDALDDLGLTEEETLALLEDPNSYLTRIISTIQSNYSKQTMYQFRLLQEAIKLGADIRRTSGTEYDDKYASGPQFDKSPNLEGEVAYQATVGRIQRMKKIHLWHSGFWVVLRRPTPDEIRYLLSYVDDEQREIGRIVGGYFYSMEDVMFVKAVMEMLPALTVKSNLRNYKKSNTLTKAIKHLDYQLIVQGLCSLLFRKGVDYEMVCPGIVTRSTTDDQGHTTQTKVACTHSERVRLDINELKKIEYNKLPPDAITMLFSNDEFTQKSYTKYSELLNHAAVVSFPAVDGQPAIDVHQKVPTCFSYIKYGMQYLGRLKSEIYDRLDTSMDEDEQVNLFTAINTYKLFQPWIDRVVFYKEDGSVDYVTRDPKAIEVVLESDMWSTNPTLTRQFMTFFRRATVVHMAYAPLAVCPVCGYTPDITATANLIPVDMNDFFSSLSYKTLLNIMSA